jgi:hypothetical protein
MNCIFNNLLGLPLIDPSSTRYFYSYSSYNLLLDSTTTQYFGMNPLIFGFPEGIGNFSFSTTLVVDTTGASYLLETSVT